MGEIIVAKIPTEIVSHWFGDKFEQLHPLLQRLHTNGGKLIGEVEIFYGKGIAGIIGGRFAAKMKLPGKGVHQLVVDISHDNEGMHWGRGFDGKTLVYSRFLPVDSIVDGYWIEQTGPISLRLTVDIIDGGWHWRCLSVKYRGMPIPSWIVPKTKAYKIIENDQYRFSVEMSLPLVGSLFSYQGLLQAQSA